MIKHTPVPWKRRKVVGGYMIFGRGDPVEFGAPGTVCRIEGVGTRQIADAILIEATPDLLCACKEALIHCQLLGSGQVSPLSNAEMCEILGAAISKAEGGIL